jgi:diguanylate cyclase (GGDEF)-like protein
MKFVNGGGADDARVRALELQLALREYEIRLLKETADALTGQLRLERLLELVTDRARELIQAETVLIPILDDSCDTYTYRAGSGKYSDEIIGQTLPLEFGICGWVWRNQRAWWQGVLEELAPEDRNRWEHEAATLIMVPLFGKQHFLGGIAGMNKRGGEPFNRRDLDLLTMFGSQVSIAIENAVTFEALESEKKKAEQYQEELRLLNQELVAINADLEHMALYDSLTGLANRYLIQDRLQQAIFRAEREKHPLAILVVDLDRFKELNDTLGHNVGDELLKQVGIRFQAKLRQADTVGRLGGDEFAILLPDASAETAMLVAEHLLQALEFPVELEGGSYAVSASIGIAVYPEHGQDMQVLLRRADVAMYVAKRARQGCFLYDPQQDRHTPRHLALMADLHMALERGQMRLFYQPKLDLASDCIVGMEALMRWQHPEYGLILPDLFIPALEQSGLIRRFTTWALDEAIRQGAEWNQLGLELGIAVNLSMYNLRDSQLPAQLAMLQRAWKAPVGALLMEVTESAVMNDPHHVSEVLDTLTEQGIRFSIDDFGTGYSSLNHLKRLPVSELKIDKSFVRDMTRDRDDEAIVRSTIDLAHNMGLRVVAEGVESLEVLDRLREMGCDEVQGYYIARPMPAGDLPAFIEQAAWGIRRCRG